MTRRIRPLSTALAVLVSGAILMGIFAPPGMSDALVQPAAAQVEPLGEEPQDDPPGLGSIIGSPEAGPDPEDAGDRGGWAQLVLAVAVFGGVGVILTRVFRAASRTTE